ncbi:histidinol-phosphate transaminase [Pedobacter nyackensis]|uniref:histidinol-phosphate transaminase n=1 Tax=Pedobacter nyackensis TaxID=475255 RepID=UPI00292D1BDC|nr:histidinol-phosphate transaminase [Pedobacter nyackensis]
MSTNRRFWLKQLGLGIAGLGLSSFKTFGSVAMPEVMEDALEDNPLILLRSNENPYGPSPLSLKAFSDNLKISNRYNWEVSPQLISAISKKNNVNDENILLGAGSTEILDLVARYVGLEKGEYVIADPSFDYWTVVLDNLGLTKIKVPLSADKKIDLNAMQNKISPATKLVYICNPNNPTGTVCERDLLLKFIAEVPSEALILVDEAYLEFTQQQSVIPLINEHPNLVVAKTFSKIYGLAGARIGYAVAHQTMIKKLGNLQSSATISVGILSKLAAMAALKDDKFVSECYALNENAKKYTADELKKLNLDYIPSSTNFIYFSLANFKQDYFQKLTDNNIQGTRIYEEQGKWTRITVGTMKEMKRFIQAIQ